ncbi:MAG: MBL fold metallo-hydrolase [Eubacterium sp.]|nr:MBL fold metallo-hydrolase [Eubacterium sp.]
MSVITELKYSSTNTYLIEGDRGSILFDTGWAGTLGAFCRAMGEKSKKVQNIDYVLISHFHPDHMGICQEISEMGPVILIIDLQREYVHSSDYILSRDSGLGFKPLIDENIRSISLEDSRDFLKNLGIDGQIYHTPGHSDDSISLWLDQGILFVGDLNPLYELESHKGTLIYDTWQRLLSLKPKKIYYGHANPSVPEIKDLYYGHADFAVPEVKDLSEKSEKNKDLYGLVSKIIKYIDRGYSMSRIQKKTGADNQLIEDVNRMYLTHQNVGVQGILDRIEIKGK